MSSVFQPPVSSARSFGFSRTKDIFRASRQTSRMDMLCWKSSYGMWQKGNPWLLVCSEWASQAAACMWGSRTSRESKTALAWRSCPPRRGWWRIRILAALDWAEKFCARCGNRCWDDWNAVYQSVGQTRLSLQRRVRGTRHRCHA